jgi:hypothetical protein
MAIIKIKNAAIDLDAAEIPNLPATKITSGTLDNARISLDAAEIPNLDTAKITTGTLADARLPANALNSNIDLTNLSASNLTSGTLPDTRFPATLPAVSGANLTGISAGNYSVHAFDTYNYTTNANVGGTTSNDYLDIAGGNYVSFTPTSTDDIIFFAHGTTVYTGYSTGADPYLMMSTSSSIGSGDTKLNFSGTYANGADGSFSLWGYVNKSFYLPCTSLSVGTTYYVEQAAGTYSTGNWWYINYPFTNNSGNHKLHNVAMTHYKKS